MIEDLKTLFNRDLNKLREEIELYQNEDKLWAVEQNISNSGGNLCLHLIGNLNAYIGVALAKTTYKRNRPLEFSLKNVPKSELISGIEETIQVVAKGFEQLLPAQLTEDFEILVWDRPFPVSFTLIHLYGHLNYHLGQINYHRRMLDKI